MYSVAKLTSGSYWLMTNFILIDNIPHALFYLWFPLFYCLLLVFIYLRCLVKERPCNNYSDNDLSHWHWYLLGPCMSPIEFLPFSAFIICHSMSIPFLVYSFMIKHFVTWTFCYCEEGLYSYESVDMFYSSRYFLTLFCFWCIHRSGVVE